jgi:hypothetical protein
MNRRKKHMSTAPSTEPLVVISRADLENVSCKTQLTAEGAPPGSFGYVLNGDVTNCITSTWACVQHAQQMAVYTNALGELAVRYIWGTNLPSQVSTAGYFLVPIPAELAKFYVGAQGVTGPMWEPQAVQMAQPASLEEQNNQMLKELTERISPVRRA